MSRADSRHETLSGRTGLWEELLGYAAERPLLGYGPGAFWSARHLEAIYATQRWPASEAHSLYLEQLLDLGAIGLSLLVLLLGGGALRAARWLRASGDGAAAFLLCIPVYFASAGALEVLHAPPSFLSFLLYGALVHLAVRHGPGAPDRAGRARARWGTPGRRPAARVPAWRGA
jgi:O-antigen ligase